MREEEVVEIPVVFKVNPTTGEKSEQKLVEAFNKEYRGRYSVEVDWVLKAEGEYRQSMKRMNVTDELPVILVEPCVVPSFYQMMIADGRLENLAPYIEADEEWKAMTEPVVWEGCTEEDGAMYLAPISTSIFSCAGIFWNQELFEQAGIEAFPETWEAFWECCDRLAECGITPLALHTDGTAWAPMLLATAELADSEEGAEFLEDVLPESYQNESGRRMAETLRHLFDYASEEALYADFDVAFDDFFDGKAAMLPNGYWMIKQISGEWLNKVRFSPFPGNKLISSPESFCWAVTSGYREEIKAGAVEFLKYRAKYNQEEKEKLLKQNQGNISFVKQDYLDAFFGNPQIVPNYQVKWNSILQEETLGQYIPELVQGKITTEEFIRLEDESIEEYENER